MENNKNQVLIKDFDLFFEAIRASSKILESAKITVSDTGLTIYGVKDRIARCEIQSNAISAMQEISFSILNLQNIVLLYHEFRLFQISKNPQHSQTQTNQVSNQTQT